MKSYSKKNNDADIHNETGMDKEEYAVLMAAVSMSSQLSTDEFRIIDVKEAE